MTTDPHADYGAPNAPWDLIDPALGYDSECKGCGSRWLSATEAEYHYPQCLVAFREKR